MNKTTARYGTVRVTHKVMTTKNSLLLSVLFFLSIPLWGQSPELASEYFVVKDLRQDWLTVDEANRYVPYVAGQKKGAVVGLPLNLTRFRGNQLRCCVPRNSSLLINQQLVKNFDRSDCIFLDIDSLRNHHAETVFLTIFQGQKDFDHVSVEIINFGQDLAEENPVVARAAAIKMNFFGMGLLTLLIFYAILKHQYGKNFKIIYNISRIFSSKVREDDTRVRLVTEANIAFLIHYCLLIAFLLIIVVPPTIELPFTTSYISFPPVSFSQYLLLWVELAVIVLVIILVKYLLLMLLGSLFRLRAMKYLHMFDFMRMSLVFWTAVFIAVICFFPNLQFNTEIYLQGLIYGFLLFALVRVIILYFRLAQNASFRNIYLFSYICVAEILPLLAGLELLIG
ncbi:DUF4271 domain-containing protein [Tunicatimonas pelagia]|uniref:DUF4271 domain-containing protein n=1 Tax=Tunicatimonas pelagia TaxID=931531 RepID=UPI002666BA94|nr:DUF4271 domain-containing protein [Tunicatimonas pelagia]WKN41815.1 DUF4271 domain-containing protein [Tunicatimonas pelagia]